uniref:FAD-binding PCMH-type domain-containing protein n=2 Tax=Ditylum brightwellii TaxID=49249 RepID=A0A7S4R235_9STRA
MVHEITEKESINEWFSKRTWSVSGNRVGAGEEDVIDTKAERVVFPRDTEEVSQILSSLPPSQPVAVVCGGHSSSNTSTVAVASAVVVDLQHLNSVSVDEEKMEVTAGGGVTFRSLAEAVGDADGALPIGTGDTVGVTGYLVNGGISGYFGRRLGMLGQRVIELTFVTADGVIKILSPSSSSDEDSTLFNSVLGAGSALGVVTSVTLKMESGSSFQSGGQVIVPCGTQDSAKRFARLALSFLRDSVLPDESVSMELVVTADFTCISTFIFYDSFKFDPISYVNPIRDAATAGNVPIVVDNVTQWNTWLEAASCLWPIIKEMKGNPLVRMDHSMGTTTYPDDDLLNFIANEWIGGVPLEDASQSIVEIRTLGGAALSGEKLPSGNCSSLVFADMIIAYDANGKSVDERRSIKNSVDCVVSLAREQKDVQVDFSATHSQADDPPVTTARDRGIEIFGR